MRRLWLADVHANLPALEAVLSAAGAVDEVVFLGDIVGFGPHPAACVERLMGSRATAVLGNHDAAVLAVSGRTTRRQNPISWNEWTFDRLSPAQVAYLTALPAEVDILACGVQVRAMHHPAGAPYLHPAMSDEVLAQHLEAVQGTHVFCGHSHRPINRTVNGFRYVCIPAVGQPRNRDPRAGYAIETDGTLSFGVVAYDVERVVSDVCRIGLDEAFCQRWIRFLRSGFDAEWSRELSPAPG
jgi:predicted phosphodiesterase